MPIHEIIGPHIYQAPDHAGLAASESSERKPLAGKVVLITGGATGTGFFTAQDFLAGGAEVIIGTSKRDHFTSIVEKLGQEKVHPLVVDLTKRDTVANQLDSLLEKGVVPTDVVHSAAGGMEPFMESFIRELISVRKEAGSLHTYVQKTDLQEKIRQWVFASHDFARAINFDGPRELFEQVIPHLAPGAKIIDYTSLWSSLLVGVPEFYKGVAGTKHMLEEWFEKQSPRLVARGIYPAIVSGHVIADSNVGKVADRCILPLLPKEQQDAMHPTFITKEDMVRSARAILESDPGSWTEYPKKVYVVGPSGQSVDRSTAEALISKYPIPL